MAVRIVVNLIYVAILVWSATHRHWPYGLIVLPFLAYGTWRLWVLRRRFDVKTQSHDTFPQHPDGING